MKKIKNINKMKRFEFKLKEDIIPRVRLILEKEKKNLENLKKIEKKCNGIILHYFKKEQLNKIKKLINNSENLIKHYETRITQYEKYIQEKLNEETIIFKFFEFGKENKFYEF